MIAPVVIDIDSWFGLVQTAGAMILEILSTITFTINNHDYSAFVVFVSVLVVSILLYQFWGGDDEE